MVSLFMITYLGLKGRRFVCLVQRTARAASKGRRKLHNDSPFLAASVEMALSSLAWPMVAIAITPSGRK